jgi:hypothetical protein
MAYNPAAHILGGEMVDVQIMIDMAMGEKDKDGSQHIARY